MPDVLNRQLSRFAIPGKLEKATPITRGHINQTFVGHWSVEGKTTRFIHQIINHSIFKDVPGMMKNISLVLDHIKKRIEHGHAEGYEKTFSIVPTHTGENFLQTETGQYLRTFTFVEGCKTVDQVTDSLLAAEAAKSCARFERHLAELEISDFQTTIPNFHDIPGRFEALERGIAAASGERLERAKAELAFAAARKTDAGLINEALASGAARLRVIHSDLKINNVLFDEISGKGVCLVDLDTCMPGPTLFDFGDMIRSAANQAREDEQQLDKVAMNPEFYRALATGFLSVAKDFLDDSEVSLLHLTPRLVTLSLGVRFLTDYLSGDTYFRTTRPEQNLDRTRAQFKLARSMEEQEVFMAKVIKETI